MYPLFLKSNIYIYLYSYFVKKPIKEAVSFYCCGKQKFPWNTQTTGISYSHKTQQNLYQILPAPTHPKPTPAPVVAPTATVSATAAATTAPATTAATTAPVA